VPFSSRPSLVSKAKPISPSAPMPASLISAASSPSAASRDSQVLKRLTNHNDP
jgi:hypothetical protein